MSRELRTVLDKLCRADKGQLAASSLTSAQRHALDDFARRTRSVLIHTQGRGVVYHIQQRAIVEQRRRELSPRSTQPLDPNLPPRAVNIARTRSSKAAQHYHECYYLLLRARHGPTLWQDQYGDQFDLSETTARLGGTLLATDSPSQCDSPSQWQTSGFLWLVENQAVFDQLDWLPTDVSQGSSVAWYRGYLPNALLDWLAAYPRAPQILFFPDYDGVGLLNYARIKERLGDHVQLWLMPNWLTRLQQYGSNDLWLDSHPQFNSAVQRLANLSPEPTLQSLIQAMQRQALALEQEAVWL